MLYIACEILSGTAHVASKEEVAEVAWCDRITLSAYVPYPLYCTACRVAAVLVQLGVTLAR
jgi:hypothetical protein